MINVLIKETGTKETLSITTQDGIDYINDFMGNNGAFDDGQFIYDKDKDVYLCDQTTFDWWSKVVSDNQTLEDRISELKATYGIDAVQEVINQSSNVELENLASEVNRALDEAFTSEN